MAFDIMSGFQVGQQLGTGQNALATTVNKVMEYMDQKRQMEQQIGASVGAGVALEKFTGPMKTEQALELERQKGALQQERTKSLLTGLKDFFPGGVPMQGAATTQSSTGLPSTEYMPKPSISGEGELSIGFEQTPESKAAQDIFISGQKKKQELDATKAESRNTAINAFKSINTKIRSIAPIQPGAAATPQIAARKMATLFGRQNPQIRSIESEIESQLGNVAIALSGETAGRLSDQDIARMKRFFVDAYTSTPDDRVLAIDRGLEIINTKLRDAGATPIPYSTLLTPKEMIRLLQLNRAAPGVASSPSLQAKLAQIEGELRNAVGGSNG